MAKDITQNVAAIKQWINTQVKLIPEEKQVLLACLAQIKTASDLENKLEFDLMFPELIHQLSIAEKSAHYQVMKEGADELFGRNVFVTVTIQMQSGEKSKRNMRGISSIRFFAQKQKLQMSFLVGFSAYVEQLKKELGKTGINAL